jgi:lipoate-protein ligase B
MSLHVIDAGVMAYQPAWDLQLRLVEQVTAGEFPAGALMLVEHPPVITIGRRAGAAKHLLASPKMLAAQGVEVMETDRGGDITFHGPGQLVAYPVLPLNSYGLNLHAYMRLLEEVVIGTLTCFGISGKRSEGATGVWTADPIAGRAADGLAKICALGIKVRRWVSFHGIALNVTTHLPFFSLINPCGLSRPVTSMREILGVGTPDIAAVKSAFVAAIGAQLTGCRVVGAASGEDGTPADGAVAAGY